MKINKKLIFVASFFIINGNKKTQLVQILFEIRDFFKERIYSFLTLYS
jgi:hypothetical protein